MKNNQDPASAKASAGEAKIEIVRHSLSHIMAMAVRKLYPEVKFGIGPAIENGFYYDFDLPAVASGEGGFSPAKITPDDLPKIEKEMQTIIKSNIDFVKKEISQDEAEKIFVEQPYKLEHISELTDPRGREASRPRGSVNSLSIYQSGDFVDLCAGPHVGSTKEINPLSFKLSKLAGAYWRGDEKNEMLTRIYGLAFATEKELADYLKMLEEAEKRDHRKIGKELDLFLIDPTVGMGLAMWQPKGAMLWRIMEDFWYQEHLKNGYELVRTPHIGSRKLWETSGHWGFYNDSMYPPLEVSQTLKDSQEGKKLEIKEEYLLKPMNCPFHVTIYNSKPRSYRDLPIRWAECGTVYRYEKSGELSGLTRVRGFTQDDAHIICAKTQVKDELKRVADFIIFILNTFGFKEFNVYLSLRDPNNKEKYAGNDEGWDFTQKVLGEVAKEQGLNYKTQEGEAAFYGPKLDYKIKDCLGREWQCSTLQFDFNLPERFDMTFINQKGEKERPYVLHRALFGSFERFIGVLIEHYAGAFPVWLSPIQAIVLPIGKAHQKYGQEILDLLKQNNIRAEINLDNETIGKKIRAGEMQKIPYLIVVGDKEIEGASVAVRSHNQDLGAMTIDKFIDTIKQKVENKN